MNVQHKNIVKLCIFLSVFLIICIELYVFNAYKGPQSHKVLEVIDENSERHKHGLKRRVTAVDCRLIIEGDEEEIRKAKSAERIGQTVSDENLAEIASNCTYFVSSYGYVTYPLSIEEEEFPIAYTILTYRDANQTEKLLRSIYTPQNVYCIHVDKSSPSSLSKALKAVADCFENVFLVSNPVDVIYAEWSRVQADLNCMSDLLEYKIKWKYLINLPGQEFPLKTNSEIVKILKLYNGSNDMEAVTGHKRINPERYEYIYEVDGDRIKRTNRRNENAPPNNLTLIKGSAYGIFCRQFVDFIINDKRVKDFAKWCKNVYSPDEYFWATLHHSEILKAPGGYTGGGDLNQWQAAYVSWGGPCTGKFVHGICIFGVGDLQKLITEKSFFANKFHIDYQPYALDCLEEWVYNKTFSTLPHDLYYYRQLKFVRDRRNL